MNQEIVENLQVKLDTLKALEHHIDTEAKILDFGAGIGRTVQVLRDLGHNAFGCDIEISENPDAEAMQAKKILRMIETEPYKLPFDDNTFDVIFSDQVFEHVQNYPETIAELKRVIKPEGCMLHTFPSRYVLIEPHVFVPLASVIQSSAWLSLWAKIGIRNEYQTGLPAQEVSQLNYDFLRKHTNYLSKNQIKKHFESYFSEVSFCEDVYLKNINKDKTLYKLSKIIPFAAPVYSTLRGRVLLAK